MEWLAAPAGNPKPDCMVDLCGDFCGIHCSLCTTLCIVDVCSDCEQLGSCTDIGVICQCKWDNNCTSLCGGNVYGMSPRPEI